MKKSKRKSIFVDDLIAQIKTESLILSFFIIKNKTL